MNHRKKYILVLFLSTAVVVAVVLLIRSNNADHSDYLLLSGDIEAMEANVGFKMPGRVIRLFKDEGDYAAKGERLAVLDSAEYEAIAAQNAAALENAEAALEKAKKDRDRIELLFKNGAVSSQQMDAAQTAYEVALAQSRQARAALKTAQVRLADTVLYAPFSGVVAKKYIEEGEIIPAGAAVFAMVDLKNIWVKVYVKEDRLGRVKLGQKAHVSVDSHPGKVYSGTVTYISSEAEFTPKNVQTREERVKLVFSVKVGVVNDNDELKPGMPADVKIFLGPGSP